MSDLIENTLKLSQSVIEAQQRDIDQLQRDFLVVNTINVALIAMIVDNAKKAEKGVS